MAFHMGFGASPSAAAQVLDALQSAAAAGQRQQAQQQQQMLKDQFDTELKLRDKGYTPYLRTSGVDASGLKRRDAQQVDPGRVMQDQFGRKWVQPLKPDATPQQTFADTRGLLENGARPVDAQGNVPQDQQIPRYRQDAMTAPDGSTIFSPTLTDTGRFGINAAPPPGTTVTPVGSQQAYFIPGEEEKAGLKARLDAQAAAAKPGTPTVDTEHFSVPVSIDHKTGKVTALQLPEGVTHNDKPEQPEKYAYGHFQNNEGRVTVTRTSDAGAEMWNGKKWVSMPAGAAIGERHRDPNEATGGQSGVQGRFDQKEVDQAISSHETLQNQEQQQWDLKQQYADAAGAVKAAEAGDVIVDPKTGREVAINEKNKPAWEKIYSDRAKDAENKALGYQKRAKGIRQRFGWGEFGQGGSQQAATPTGGRGNAGTPAATPAGGRGGQGNPAPRKLTDASVAAQYLQKAAGNKDKARQLAKADGWEF